MSETSALEACPKGRVLVVDDDPRCRLSFRHRLQAEGFQVLEAESGPQALKIVGETPPDVILLDVVMPGMDGFEVCKHLKQDRFTAAIPIILITALADNESRMRGIESGAADFLSKPLDFREVLVRVKNAMSLQHLIQRVQRDEHRIRELESARDELTMLIMREMKAPLVGLVGLLELASDRADRHTNREFADCMREALGATETLCGHLDSLLDVRKMKAGEMPLTRVPCDLLQLVEGAVESVRAALAPAEVEVRLTGAGVHTACDVGLLRRVVQHLVRIAVARNSAATPVEVAVAVQGTSARVAVSDRGPDLSEEQCRSLLGPLSGESVKMQDAGISHLGVEFCRLVCESHGGTMGIDRRANGGMTFWIALPAGDSVKAEAERAAVAIPAVKGEKVRHSRRKSAADLLNDLAMQRRGSREQFGIAVGLISVIPLLSFVYVLADGWRSGTLGVETVWFILPLNVVLVSLGLYLLKRHTVEVSHLRRCLELMASGELPEKIGLDAASDDMLAIEKCLDVIVRQTEERIQMIESQARVLVKAEQRRVMTESLAAACHHLGQPMAVICGYLEFMKKRENSEEMQRMIDECLVAVESVSEVFKRLRAVAEYRTEPYLADPDSILPAAGGRILSI